MDRTRVQNQEPADPTAARLPWAGIVASAVGFIVMVAIAWTLWDSLPETIVTREATETRSGVAVPRVVMAFALPGVLIVVGAIMTVSTVIGGRMRHYVDPRLVASPRSQTRSMNVLFVVLPLLLVTLQAGLLSRAAGHEFPLERAVGVAVGIMLIGMGNVLPKISPSRMPDGPNGALALAWQRSQRAGGLALMILGAICAVGSFFFPPFLLVMSAALLVVAAYVLMILLTVFRTRR
ncbi:hypothetical protein ACFFR3_35405 [Nonomuraea salmonea]|jgi:hypothetical protein|uniref:DUF1648 domain-containing protein n=2 Tax=Nonomuraea salmonea TaxID=46181 RepID=A0ABV5NWX1_9ACTN